MGKPDPAASEATTTVGVGVINIPPHRDRELRQQALAFAVDSTDRAYGDNAEAVIQAAATYYDFLKGEQS